MRAKLFRLEDLKKITILESILKKHYRKFKKFPQDLILRQIIRETINQMVEDVIINTKKNLNKYNIKTVNDVYKCKYTIVCFSKKMSLFDISIKKFLKKRMYFHKTVIRKTNFGKKIINHLFFQIKKNPKKYIDMKKINKSDTDRAICDFIAGMTDRFAINLYNKSK